MRALAGLSVLSAAAGLSLPDAVSRADAVRSLALPLGGAVAFRTGAAVAVIGQPRCAPLDDGRHPFATVGCRVARVATDAPDGGSCRVKVFYPAAAEAAAAAEDAAYCTDGRATADGMAGLVGFRQLGLSFLLAHLADARSGCARDAQPAGEQVRTSDLGQQKRRRTKHHDPRTS